MNTRLHPSKEASTLPGAYSMNETFEQLNELLVTLGTISSGVERAPLRAVGITR